MIRTKKRVFIIIGIIVIIVAAVVGALYANGNLTGEMVNKDNAAASLSIEGGKEVFYATASEAWSKIPTDEYTVMKLYKDWTSDSEGNLGKGTGFSNGIIVIRDRSDNLDLDLNGFAIDRGLYDSAKSIDKPKEGGSVFYACADATVAIKNGTIRGGNAIGDGGGIYFGGDDGYGRIGLYNITISDCKADEGSAIYYRNDNTQELVLDNVTITGNTCNKSCGGAVRTDAPKVYSKFIVHNKVVIKDNYGPGEYGNNLSLWGGIKGGDTLSLDSEIFLYKPYDSELNYNSNKQGNRSTTFIDQGEYIPLISKVVNAENGHLECTYGNTMDIIFVHH